MSTIPRYYQNLCYSMNSWTDMTLVHSRTPLAQKKVINKLKSLTSKG